MNVVKKIYADGRIEEGNWKMSLEELQQFVGGYIERVRCSTKNRALIVNEEGFYEHLAPNPNATALVAPGTALIDGTIRGNALLVKA
jgi:hypothetical protein